MNILRLLIIYFILNMHYLEKEVQTTYDFEDKITYKHQMSIDNLHLKEINDKEIEYHQKEDD